MDMKRDYYEDIQLFESNVVLFWSMALLLFLFTLPLYTPNYYFYLLNLILVHVILAVGLNILVGYTGQISLGHAGFFAIGAYGTALLMFKLQFLFPALLWPDSSRPFLDSSSACRRCVWKVLIWRSLLWDSD